MFPTWGPSLQAAPLGIRACPSQLPTHLARCWHAPPSAVRTSHQPRNAHHHGAPRASLRRPPQATLISVIVLNQLVGPPLFEHALRSAGEAGRCARARAVRPEGAGVGDERLAPAERPSAALRVGPRPAGVTRARACVRAGESPTPTWPWSSRLRWAGRRRTPEEEQPVASRPLAWAAEGSKWVGASCSRTHESKTRDGQATNGSDDGHSIPPFERQRVEMRARPRARKRETGRDSRQAQQL
eukprot:7387092-Prymnesium_polylepis.2